MVSTAIVNSASQVGSSQTDLSQSGLSQICGYQLVQQLYSGQKTAVYRANSTDASEDASQPERSVIIKVLQQTHPSFTNLVQFRNQFSITKDLDIAGVIRPIGLEPWQNGYALIAEDFGGISLHQYKKSIEQTAEKGVEKTAEARSLPLQDCLDIAQQLAAVLHELAQHRIVHKDIKPANILICPETKRIELVDFSIATLLLKETLPLQNPQGLEGTLAYLAPEQTGRMNRGIDYRTDFYSLGITLYELLTGQLPFQADDPLELVHCHIAKTPTAPHQINPEIPSTVSAIILKLMAKNAENRYQSASGLHHDLKKCLKQWQKTGKVMPFELAKRDLSDRFTISEKLYGRQAEVQALLRAFERVAMPAHNHHSEAPNPKISLEENSHEASSEDASHDFSPLPTVGRSEMMLIAGKSGIGKTAIINEVHKPITRQQGYFIKGKFDQLGLTLPLSALLQALEDLVEQLLSESDTKLAQWRQKILATLKENAQVLIEVLPSLEKIVGMQPAAPELSGSATQNRFNRLLQAFISLFASPRQPLVIFIDDLQWADSASLQVIEQLIAEQKNVLFLGAYRDNEVSAAHPFVLTVEAIKKKAAPKNSKNNIAVTTLTLGPLATTDVNQLIADTLHCSTRRAEPLTETVLRKTSGNPFFTTQFLKSLYEEGHIYFNQAERYWECDITQINTLACSDDVVEFMSQQLQKLPARTQRVFQLAACIGNQFDLETLSIAADRPCAETAEALWQGLHEGLLIPQSDTYKFYLDKETNKDPSAEHSPTEVTKNVTYRFLHDRVQQAAYRLIDEDQKQFTHLKIGQRLLDHTDEATREDALFDIVNHLNIGAELIDEEAERSDLSQLNLRAGQKAKAATAYPAAIEYFTTGIDLLEDSCWESQYVLALPLHEAAAEAALLCGEFEQMETWASLVLTQAKVLGDRVKTYEIQIQAYASRNLFLEAISVGTNALKLFGISLPAQPGPEHIQQAFGETIELLSSKGINAESDAESTQARSIAELANLAPMSDPGKLAVIQLTSAMVPAAFLSMPTLFPLLVLSQIQTTVAHGNSPQAAYNYAAYALLLNIILKDIKTAARFAGLAIDLTFAQISKEIKAKAYFTVAAFIKHHTHHLNEAIVMMLESYQMAIEGGDLEFVGYAAFHLCYDSYLVGNELAALEQSIDAYAQVLEKCKQLATLNYCKLCQQVVLNLMEEEPANKNNSTENNFSNPSAEDADIKEVTVEEETQEGFSQASSTPSHRLAGQLIGEAFDENTALPQLLAVNDITGLYLLYVHKLMLSVLFEETQQAQVSAQKARDYAAGGAGFAITPSFYLYEALTVLKTLSNEPAIKEQQLKHVEDNINELQHWANHAPMNYTHKAALVKAERDRALGNRPAALEHYETAITTAKAQGYVQEAALANELAAQFYLDWGKAKVAAGYLQEAYYGYARWGAKAKVKHLERHYQRLLRTVTLNEHISHLTAHSTLSPTATYSKTLKTAESATSSATTSQNIWLDFISITKAAQAISQEIELEKLLTALMQIVLSNAGAQHGYLILRQGEQWVIKAQSDGQQVLMVNDPVDTSNRLPEGLIYSVARTQKAAVFENLSQAKQFESDRYISFHQPKSALCLPISRQGQLMGILYLENNLIEGAFTSDRIETLQVLTSQAAISIENARLYKQTEQYSQSLEAEVSRKTQALNQKVEDLEKTLTKLKETQAQLIQTEKMSSLGQLVAGVAHEINNPINFIHTNIKHLGTYNQDLLELVKAYAKSNTRPPAEVKELLEEIDLEFVSEDSEQLVKSVNNGSDRIKQIVLSLRNFSRLDESDIKHVNIHEGINSTLVILRHRLKATPVRPEILVEKTYRDLPLIECHPGQLNQVLMNVLNNAVDALAERVSKRDRQGLGAPPTIQIWTELLESERIAIHIADNGTGIPEEMRSRIFDPFFTTKAIGEGPGLGLSTSYQIITDIHGGKLYCHSELGKGTEMVIELPVTIQ